VRLVAQQRSGRVRQKQTASNNWTAEKQSSLFKRLMSTSWQERAQTGTHPDGDIEEAIVNDVSTGAGVASPSPEMRQSMRVMDLYYFGDEPSAEKIEAQELYNQAEKARHRGKIEEAIRLYRQAYELEPRFFAALNEVGVLLMQTGNLRDALKVYLTIVEHQEAGDIKYIAATNAADVYLHWFDAGRNKERNIERAAHYAKMAMQKPTPMRACNLILAYVKDRYYVEAQQVMERVLHSNLPGCPADKFLQTLFQIRDADLVAWWSWLDSEMGKDEAR
jgi:tetratricopeptide (TPR) repeat protein